MRKDLDVLTTLLTAAGPSGHEHAIQEIFTELMAPHVSKQYSDNVGNCYSELAGAEGKPRIMFTAHCDTVGFMVKHIDDRGFIFTQDIPGYEIVDFKALPGTDVVVLCRRDGTTVDGHFTPITPIHMRDDAEEFERHELAIDIGSNTHSETTRHVSIGDYVLMKPGVRLTANKHKLVATNLDDRLGMYCMYLMAKRLSRMARTKKCPVIFASTVSEEGGVGASAATVKTAEPDISITVEVEPATDVIVHNADFAIAKQHGSIRLGHGVVITRGLAITDAVFLRLEEIAKKQEIAHQISLSDMATDNQFIHTAGAGVRTALVSVPVRNCHTRVETMDLKDIDTTVDLCVRYVRYADQGKHI